MLAFVRVDVYADSTPTYDYYLYVHASSGDLKVNASGEIFSTTTMGTVDASGLADYMYTSEQGSPANKFQTLYAAWKAAPDDKNTKIIMLSDIVMGDGIVSSSVSGVIDNQYRVLADNKKITLDLNGNTLDGEGRFSCMFKADHGGVLTIEGAGTITEFGQATTIAAYNSSKVILKDNCSIVDSGRVLLDSFGEFEMQSGTINNCSYLNEYSPVYIAGGGKFTMSGGTITDCNLYVDYDEGYAGAVYIQNGTFEMSGGTITNCNTSFDGGTVWVKNGSTFTMTGGTISNCTGGNGGAVYVDNGTFGMSGGTITECSANTNGGAVCVNNGCTFTMTGGTISHCTCTAGDGDAVYVDNGGIYIITGTITECGTGSDGGVYISDNHSGGSTGSISSFDGKGSVIETIDYAASHDLTAEINGIDTLTAEHLNYLKSKPEVTLILNYSYEGIDYRIEIPGTYAAVEPGIYYYGPLKLYEMYGPNGTIKATVDSVYVIRGGDTLSRIAARFNVKLKRLLELNSYIQNPNKIYAGNTLIIK